MNLVQLLNDSWSKKYKKSINCSNPKGFSQKAHCAGRKARQSGKKTKSSSVNEAGNLQRIHYFRVEAYNEDIAKQIGLKQDRAGNWVLYQFKDDSYFNRKFSDAVRAFGQPRHSQNINESSETTDLTIIDALKDFLPLVIRHLDLDHVPHVKLQRNIIHNDQPTFGRFENDTNTVHLAIDRRHPVDILRTLAHELVHYKQNLEHKLDDTSGTTGSPAENEANARAGIIMREFNKQHPEYLKLEPVELP